MPKDKETMRRGRPKKGDVGETLRRLRLSKGWSLRQLARFTGIPDRTLHAYELNSFPIPSDRLKILAEVFGVSVDHLVTGEDTPAQFARQYPGHFQILNRAAKELPANKFEQIRKFVVYMVVQQGDIPGFDWEKIIDAHQDSLEKK
jgi:transcriptional regulator with XRE-family HTH domain